MTNPFFDHPVLNSPYDEPARHWELDDQGQPTQQVIERWSAPFVDADQAPGLIPLPRHLLDEAYRGGDKSTFTNSPYLSTEFVGLGPYKLAHWERGSALELVRFDQY